MHQAHEESETGRDESRIHFTVLRYRTLEEGHAVGTDVLVGTLASEVVATDKGRGCWRIWAVSNDRSTPPLVSNVVAHQVHKRADLGTMSC